MDDLKERVAQEDRDYQRYRENQERATLRSRGEKPSEEQERKWEIERSIARDGF